MDSFYFPSQFLSYWVALLQDENKKKEDYKVLFNMCGWLFTFWSQHSIKELQGTCINRVMFTLEFILINTCIFSQNKSENIWAKMDIITEYLLSRNLFTWTVGFPVANYVCANFLSKRNIQNRLPKSERQAWPRL